MKKTIHIQIFVFVACATIFFLPSFSIASDSSPVKSNSAGNGEWLRGIVRVNTDVSSGDESLSIVCEKAEKANLDFIVVSDQFLVRAEYGILPFRYAFSYACERKSVIEFGVERYLSRIDDVDAANEALVLIPGVDVAPHYYWSGFPFSHNFGTHQFSEQLTVFGTEPPRFYRNLPVIHNESSDFSVNSIIKMLPLMLVVAGCVLLFHLRVDEYRDATGQLLDSRIKKSRLIVAPLLILLGLVWTLDNRPFSRHLGFDQYSDKGNAPYQRLVDYVRTNGGDGAGVFWSAPEATTRTTIMKTSLETTPYLSDVLTTFGHNGMAGLYGDAITALRPGGEWDAMLLDYCVGKRHVRPIVLGELDYHGRKRRIDMYQTVVRGAKKNRLSIVKAIIEGRSYAYAKPAHGGIKLIDAHLSAGTGIAKLGETLKVAKNAKKLVAKVTFELTGESTNGKRGDIQIIANGKLVKKEKFKGARYQGKFPIDVKSLFKEKERLGYVRFDISSRTARIVTNPIFIKFTNKSK